jgi:hypothetical protein
MLVDAPLPTLSVKVLKHLHIVLVQNTYTLSYFKTPTHCLSSKHLLIVLVQNTYTLA